MKVRPASRNSERSRKIPDAVKTAAAAPAAPSAPGFWRSYAAVYSCLWILYSAVTLALHVINPHSPLHADLTPGGKLNLMSGEFVLGSIALLAVSLPAMLCTRMKGLPRLLLAGLIYLLYAGFLLLSWGQAVKTTYFAGSGSMQMLVTNPVALFQHALSFHPTATTCLPVAVLGLAAASLYLTVRPLLPSGRLPVAILFSLVLLCTGFFYIKSISWSRLPLDITQPYNSPVAGQVLTLGDYLNELYARQSGPLTTLVAEKVLARKENLVADPSIPVTRKPIITIDEYVRSVDPGRLHKYNVLLILVESLRTSELMAYGCRLDVMPNVNALAKESLVFLNNYTSASHSNYADLVSMSSHYPLRSNRTHVYPKNPSYPRVMIYDVLKRLGYHTAVISSQNESWGCMNNYLSTEGLDELLDSENFDGATYRPDADVGFSGISRHSGKVDDSCTVDRMSAWMKSRSGAPFFIYTNFQNSHFPFVVGPGFKRRFSADNIDFEPNFNFLPPEQVPVMQSRYRDSLAYIDAQIGRLFAFLKKEGMWDNTIVVISGDTGQAFMEHGFSGHASLLYNEVLKTPLLIRIPGRAHDASNRLVGHLDVAPTVLGAIGLAKHPSFQGLDLLNEPESADRELFLVAQTPLVEEYAIVKYGYKLIYHPFSNSDHLYNLSADPGEEYNIAKGEPALTDYLHNRLSTWRKLQVDYYTDESQHMTTYPPVMGYGPPFNGK